MNLTSDKMATMAGLGMGVLNSVATVAGQMQPGTSLHQGDYVNLGVSLLMMFLGWLSNKQNVQLNLQSPVKSSVTEAKQQP